MPDTGRVLSLAEALEAGMTPYQICCCPKLEGTGAALVVGWNRDCLLHEGEGPDDDAVSP